MNVPDVVVDLLEVMLSLVTPKAQEAALAAARVL
jgi:hypothetical protein